MPSFWDTHLGVYKGKKSVLPIQHRVTSLHSPYTQHIRNVCGNVCLNDSLGAFHPNPRNVLHYTSHVKLPKLTFFETYP